MQELNQKPPLVVVPRWRWDELHPCFQLDLIELRYQMLIDAMFRYSCARVSRPDEWFNEFVELQVQLVEERRWARDPLNIFEPYLKELEFNTRYKNDLLSRVLKRYLSTIW
jgi:hypothetical protein